MNAPRPSHRQPTAAPAHWNPGGAPSSRGGIGFTLVELLVAAGITTLIAGFIAVIVMNISTTWSRASTRLSTDAQARLILDQIQLDLQGALYRDDGNVWMAAEVLDRTSNSGLWDNTNAVPQRIKPAGAPWSLRMNQTSLADARYGQAGVWLRFFTTRRGRNLTGSPGETASAPVAVGYQIIRRPTATNTANQTVNRAYLLHRAETRPAAEGNRLGVMEYGFNLTAAAYTTGTGTSNNNGSQSRDPLSLRVPGTNNPPRNLDSVLGENVIDFGIRAYVRDPAVAGGLRLVFPANANGALANTANSRLLAALPSGTPPSEWGNRHPFPDVIDVMVRVLTDKGAELIANLERVQTPALAVPQKYQNNVQQWWWGVAEENSRVYTRRIVLHSAPL